jgi:hypothetical protein
VPGLRREEVALLAGVSVDYYTQMERGNLHAGRPAREAFEAMLAARSHRPTAAVRVTQLG